MTVPFYDLEVERVFLEYSQDARVERLKPRALIFEVAANTQGIGEIYETLKWGQLSYLT